MRKVIGILMLVFSVVASRAQTAAITGVEVRPQRIQFARGELTTIQVAGLKIDLTDPIFAKAGERLPFNLGGVSLRVRNSETGTEWPVPILSIRPNNGLAAVTVQIPYEMDIKPWDEFDRFPFVPVFTAANRFILLVSEGGSESAQIRFNGVRENLRVLRSCDFVFESDISPTGSCWPMLFKEDGSFIVSSPEQSMQIESGQRLTVLMTGFGSEGDPRVHPQLLETGAPSPDPPIQFRWGYRVLQLPNATPQPTFRQRSVSGPPRPGILYANVTMVPGLVGIGAAQFVVPAGSGVGCLNSIYTNTSSVAITFEAGSYDGLSLCVPSPGPLPSN